MAKLECGNTIRVFFFLLVVDDIRLLTLVCYTCAKEKKISFNFVKKKDCIETENNRRIPNFDGAKV